MTVFVMTAIFAAVSANSASALQVSQAPSPARIAALFKESTSVFPRSTELFKEVDLQCFDQKPQKCHGQAPRVHTNETASILRGMRETCLGDAWSDVLCHLDLHFFRAGTFHRIQDLVGKHLEGTASMCESQPVKKFRSAGGVSADIPCRKEGKTAQLFYRHIYKDAGLAIKKNLFADAGLRYADAIDRDWKVHNRCDELTAARDAGANPMPVLFTFVRNPIEKFIAGYKELCTRHLLDKLRGHRVGTNAHAKAFLDMVMQGTCDNGHVLIQAQSLLGFRCESKFDFIGKLENFTHDWHQLSTQAQCDRNIAWPQEVAHASQVDDGGADAAMRKTLDADHGKLMKALCWWTLPDFVLFEYELPEVCAKDKALHAHWRKALQ